MILLIRVGFYTFLLCLAPASLKLVGIREGSCAGKSCLPYIIVFKGPCLRYGKKVSKQEAEILDLPTECLD